MEWTHLRHEVLTLLYPILRGFQYITDIWLTLPTRPSLQQHDLKNQSLILMLVTTSPRDSLTKSNYGVSVTVVSK